MTTKATTRVMRPRERPEDFPSDPTINQASLQYIRGYKVVRIALTAGAANSFPFTWQNPSANKIIVHEVIVNITTAGGTATAVLDIGPTTGATGTADTILDGIDLNATGVYSSHNVTDTGTNGNEKPVVLDENGGTTPWITGKCLVEKCDNLVGNVFIYYTEVAEGTDVTIAQTTTRIHRPREQSQDYPSDTAVSQADLDNTKAYKVKKINLTAGAANAFAFAWQNPEGNKIIIHEVILRITTAGGTGSSVLDIGPATGATGTSNTILDGVDANATGIYSSHNISDTGGSGNEKPHVLDENGGTTPYLTCKILVANALALVGAAYVFYTEVAPGTDVQFGKTTTRVIRPRERPQNYPSDTSVSQADLESVREFKVAKVDLTQNVAGNTYIFTWQNPEANKIIIHEVIVNVTTAAGAAATMNLDVTASAVTNGDTIFDGLALVGTGVYGSHNVSDTGTNGNEKAHVCDENGGANDWVTGYEAANQAYTTLVGAVYIFYTEV